MMTWTKLKLGAAVAVSVILGSAGAVMTIGPIRADSQAMAAVVSAATTANRSAEPGDKNAGITSVEDAPPVVVTTSPQAGATDVDPNITEIKVTFSKEMQDGSWSFVQTGKETYPTTTGDPHFEENNHTCVLPVKLEPGKTYVIWFNHAPYTSFTDGDGRSAVPYLLVFETRK